MRSFYTPLVSFIGILFSINLVVSGQTSIPTGSFTTTCPNSGTATWDNSVLSGGDRVLVFMKQGSAITNTPAPTSNYSTYTASSDWSSQGTAYQRDAAAFCVYKGTGGNVALTNLTPNQTYFFLIYNTDAGTTYSASGLTFSGTTPAAPGDASVLSASAGNGQSIVSWTNPSTCFDEVLVVGSSSTISGTPTGNGSAYTGNLALGSGTAFSTGFVVYKGSTSPQTITNLTNGLTYTFKVWSRRGTTWSSGIQTTTTLPPSPATGGSFSSSCVDSGTASWTNPGTIYNLVVFRSTAPISIGTPTANASTINIGDAYENDGSATCVYNATSGNSVNFTGLSAGTNYYFLVFNVSGTNYSNSVTFNNSTPASPPNATSPNTTPGNGQINLSWTNPASCFDEILVVARESSAVSVTPTGNGSAYTASATFGTGTAISAGQHVVYKGTGTSVLITNLTNCVVAHFAIFTRKGNVWSSGLTTSNSPTAPVTVTGPFSPANAAVNVATNTKLTINFNQNVSISGSSGSAASQRITVTGSSSGAQNIARSSGNISISGSTATITIGALTLGETVSVVVGDKVFAACGNDFGGISSGWSFTVSPGVNITKPNTSICQNTFTNLGNIVIQETAVNNFQGVTSASRTLILSFDNTGFAFKSGTSGVTITGTGGDITAAAATAVSFGGATLTLTFSSGNVIDDLDQITIQGLQIISDGTQSTANVIVDASSTISIQGITNGTTDVATVNNVVGSSTPPTFGSWSSGNGQYCQGTNINSITASVAGTTITWFSDVNLTTPVYTGNTANLVTNLGVSSSTPQTYNFYASETSTCKSPGLLVPIVINPTPVADAGSYPTIQCPGNPIQLGGSPTVSTPSTPPYNYTWTELTGNYTGPLPPANSTTAVNPVVTINNLSSTVKNFQFRVLVTDLNNCTSISTNNFNVYPKINPILTQPAANSFTTNTPAQTLDANFPATSFTGIGVVQTGSSTFKFDPQQAYDKTQVLPQQFDVYFNGTDPNGCPISNYQIATFFLSNSTFTFLQDKYCESEYPYSASSAGINLQLSGTANTNLTNYQTNWNNSYRKNYNGYTVPLWNAGISYNAGDLVYLGSEIYRSTINGNIGQTPGASGFWSPGAFTISTTSYSIRNYYEGYYGGNTPNPTIRKSGSIYYLYTNPNYSNCAACSYSYPAVYVEFENPLDVRYRLSPWYPSGGYYYPNDLVTYGGQIFKCITFNISNAGIPPSISPNWTNVTGSGFDTGSVFYDPIANKSGFYILGQFVQVNRTPIISLAGLADDQNICEQDLSSTAFVFNLKSSLQTGSVPNAGTFEISFDGGNTWVKDLASSSAINNTGINTGLATFNSKNAYAQVASVASGGSYAWNSSTTYSKYANVAFGGKFYSSLQNSNFNRNPSTSPTFWQDNTLSVSVRLYYDPGTTGSSNSIICSGTDVTNVYLHKTPTVSFQVPTAAQVFCTGDSPQNINTVQNSGVVLTGYGITSNVLQNGTGIFTPSTAFDQSVSAGGSPLSPQNITVTATITDAFSCQNKVSNSFFTVNNPPPASYTITSPTINQNVFTNTANTIIPICYNDATITFTGAQGNSFFEVVYAGTVPPNYLQAQGSFTSPQNSFTFNPKTYFDDAVSRGASSSTTNSFKINYYSFDTKTPPCVTSIKTITLSVAPQLQVTISGINNGDVYCSNEGNKVLTLNPYYPGTSSLTINGNPTALTGATYSYPLNLALGTQIFSYNVSSGSGNVCQNPITVSIRVLPSPSSSFAVTPQCDGATVNFIGSDNSSNTGVTPNYLWTIEDNPVYTNNSASTSYKFKSIGNFNVTLDISYAADPASGKVCSSNNANKKQIQTIGPIPTVDFNFSNVCEGDATNFASSQTNGVVDYKWDFDPANSTGFGLGTNNITAMPNTSGTFKDPIRTFIPSTYSVTLTGRTAANAGACLGSVTRVVSILPKQTIDPSNFYDMGNTNGGWVLEDRGGNANWSFSTVSPDGTLAKNLTAWNNVPFKSSDQSYVNSPCFDMSAYTKPAISLKYFMDARQQQDGAVLQYSTKILGGVQQWVSIGQIKTGLSWYNTQGISGKPGDPFNANFYGWSTKGDTDWSIARHALDIIPQAERSKVRFRIAFGSDQGSTNGAKGFAFNGVTIVERNRVSLIENFTNANAQNAVANNISFQNFNANNPEIVKLQYNIALPTPDAINKQNPSDPNARAAFYGITNSTALIPGAYIDGKSSGDFTTNWLPNAFSLRSLKASPLTISFPNSAGLKATAKPTQNITSGSLRFYVALIEKSVGSDQFVVRKMFPDASGQVITLPFTTAQTVTLDATPWNITSQQIGNISQLAAVAFVQDIDTKEVLQAAYLPTLTNLPAIVTAIEPDQLTNLSFYPIPADKELVVSLPEVATQNTPLVIYDAVGKSVHQTAIDKGQQSKTISTQEFAPGVYLIQLETDKGVVRKKVMVVH